MIYGFCGGCCGISPAEVDRMSLWEYGAMRDAWMISQGGTPAGAGDISDDRLGQLGVEGFE